MKIENEKLDNIKSFENNAKLHPDWQIDQIVKSIQEFGFNDPIALDENNVIIEGHGRYLAAKKMEMDEIPVIKLLHLDETKRRAYILAHNKLTMNTGFDEKLLKQEFEFLIESEFDFELTGFNQDELSDFGIEFEDDEDDGSADIIPEVDEKNIVIKSGDIVELGNHKLLCGDSTNIKDVEKLMGGGIGRPTYHRSAL